ncbi:ribonuclease HII [Fredinandcohnia quinoae]|uniref:Ribonuclease HII n=1 Tax=Fredinandcohnia quinoae TaxID=2918902 RepID=A0AAW5E363_9BACI|nr:ribonuclease HII [Fredinandcohnia sp. SECRCQ15]MCH1623801.1 ribonuclease HII [Fredinandcohnia sp. SECRCQ15]
MSQLPINEIEKIIKSIEDENHEFIINCKKDERKGVQALLQRWQKRKEKERKLKDRFFEMMTYENSLYNKGIKYIAGVDEVGRGPLAGPVVAAAVILPQNIFLPGLNDSKKLTETKREELFEQIMNGALSIGVGIITPQMIDEVNIYQATKQAMKKAVMGMALKPDLLLVDAMEIPIQIPQSSIIKGDEKSNSIAAASIIAKVTRDRLMKRLGEEYPQYGFERNMGYGTAIHMEALQKYGITKEHRKSFSPIRELINNDKG